MNKIMTEVFQHRKRVALYLRLSKEDIDKDNPLSKSESIKNQERMLREKAEKENWEIVDVYIDEDVSGVNSNRPEFNRLLNDCENGKVDIVLCKSQSRFTRDMEQVEKYIHRKFVEWNVRFVGLVDNADTEVVGNKKSRQIYALVNEWYVEDASENLRYTLKNKKQSGLFTSAFAPYGYKKNEKDKNHLIIDEPAAEIVKEIFRLYLSGWGYVKIAKHLHENKVMCPNDYKRKNGLNIPDSVSKEKINSIERKGGYITTFTVSNPTLKNMNKIMCLVSIPNRDNSIEISIRKLSEGMKCYYLDNKLNHLNINDISENFDKRKMLNVDDIIPSSCNYILVEIDRILITRSKIFEFETLVDKRLEKEFVYNLNVNNSELQHDIEYQNKFFWSTNTIKDILRNETYIGNLVQGKYTNISYKEQKSKRVPKEKWIIVPNTHEPIIDMKTWLAVQERLKKRTRTDHLTGTINPLSKEVYCEVCNRTFEKTSGSNHRHEYMVCRDNRYFWKHCDNKSFIRLDYLENIILSEINNLIEKNKDDNLLIKEASNTVENNMFESKIATLKLELKNIENNNNNKEKYFQQLYEDRVNKIITEEQFFSLAKIYNKDVEQLNLRKIAIEKELELLRIKQSQKKNAIELFKKYGHIEKLTFPIVNEWIDKIVIGKIEDTGERNIKITWNFN